MGEAFTWKQIAFDPIQPNGVCKELWVHGPVYQLVKKGVLLDTDLHCYASHWTSKAAVWLQFGEHGTLCSRYDDAITRNTNLKRALDYMESHKLAPQDLISAEVHADDFNRNVKQFVEFYFRKNALDMSRT